MTTKPDIPRMLLQDLFERTEFARTGVNHLRFRADHSAEIPKIDLAERSGFIRRDADVYFLTLLGVAEIDTPEARTFFATAEKMHCSLSRRYRLEPGAPVQIADLASEFDLDFRDAFFCAALMFECYPCFGGFSGRQAADQPEIAQITPSEGIMSYPSFESCVEYMRSMRSQFQPEAISSFFPLQELASVGHVAPRPPPRLKASLPENQARLLDEVYGAIERNLLTLASMGLRAVIDMVCLDQIGDAGTFREKMNELQKAEVVSKRQVDILLKVINSGNASAHRGFTPDNEDIETVLAVVEHLLESVYLHPNRVAELDKKTPPRRQKSP